MNCCKKLLDEIRRLNIPAKVKAELAMLASWAKNPMYICDNCGGRYPATNKLKHVFPDIPDLPQRLDPGGTVPAGECPACGALVYPMPVRATAAGTASWITCS